MELLVQQDQGGLVNVGVNRLHISSYYHPDSTQRLLEVITIVVILDQELLKVHGVSLLILTLDGNIVMCRSVVRPSKPAQHCISTVVLAVWHLWFGLFHCAMQKSYSEKSGYLVIINMI